MIDTVLLGGLVLGLVQVVKVTLGVTKRFIPITALVISGLVFGAFAFFEGATVLDWSLVSTALVTALTAVGMWSGTKATLE